MLRNALMRIEMLQRQVMFVVVLLMLLLLVLLMLLMLLMLLLMLLMLLLTTRCCYRSTSRTKCSPFRDRASSNVENIFAINTKSITTLH